MASYAEIAHHNTSGPQPHPNPALLNTAPGETTLPDVDSKVNVVPQSFKTHPTTVTSDHSPGYLPYSNEDAAGGKKSTSTSHAKNRQRKEKAKDKLHEAEDEGLQLWAEAKDRLLRPGVLGGLMGVVNVGILGTFGYQLYYKPHLRSDTRAITTAAIGTLVLFGAEGYVAEAYRETAAGQEEERRAREEGAAIYRRTKDIVLRPGVLGGLVGVLNLGILGGVGYASYINWDRPTWDRRTVSAVSVGLLALFAGEGYLAEEYKENEYPKRK